MHACVIYLNEGVECIAVKVKHATGLWHELSYSNQTRAANYLWEGVECAAIRLDIQHWGPVEKVNPVHVNYLCRGSDYDPPEKSFCKK